VIVWEASTGRQLQSIKLPNVIPTALAVTLDARRAFVGGDSGDMHYCNLEAGTQTPLLCGHKHEVTDMALSPDGWLLISGCLDRSVRLWETLTGKEVLHFQGHLDAVAAVAFSPCGRLVATAGGALRYRYPVEDSLKIRIWDVRTGSQVAEFQGHDSYVTSLAFSPDGETLACGLSNSTALIWKIPAELRKTNLPPQRFAPQELTRLWEDLASSDAAQARQAIWKLTGCPAQAVALIQSWLKPAALRDAKQIQRWITDLNSNQFAAREKATQALEGLGESVEQALKHALENHPAPEMQQRLERLLEKTHAPVASPELVRSMRAVEVLERIGTREAQDVLKGLTRGDPESGMTKQAKASVDRLRLAKRPDPSR
jgi:WD40 repeat protein